MFNFDCVDMICLLFILHMNYIATTLLVTVFFTENYSYLGDSWDDIICTRCFIK